MRIKNILYITICLLALFPKPAKAQFGFDVVSVEAYINDHKEQRSLLLVRSTLEASNKLLHDYSSDANIDFKNINKELDKYTREPSTLSMCSTSLCVPASMSITLTRLSATECPTTRRC